MSDHEKFLQTLRQLEMSFDQICAELSVDLADLADSLRSEGETEEAASLDAYRRLGEVQALERWYALPCQERRR